MKSLSQGEKKAMYILNIIFEIEVRRRNNEIFLRRRDIDRRFKSNGEPFHLGGPMVQSARRAI